MRDAVVTRDKKSKKVFKIKSPQAKLILKAADENEREQWVQALTRVARIYEGEDISKRIEGFDQPNNEYSDRKVPKHIKTVKTVTLNQISDILQK